MGNPTTTMESKLTLSLAASGGTKLIPLEGQHMLGLNLNGPTATPDADGTIQFRLTNDPSVTPVAMTNPQVEVTAATAIAEFVDLSFISAAFVQVYWDRDSGGAAETLTILISKKGK